MKKDFIDNNHLESVFKNYLLELEKSQIDYWVYGGIAVAAYANKGEYIRRNDDVDIFVKEEDFSKTKDFLKEICNKQKNTKFEELKPLNRDGFSRPELEVRFNKEEILSVVPLYQKDDNFTLVFGNGAKAFSKDILEKVKRDISGNRFFTSPNKYIREIFLNCFRSKKNWKTRSDIRKDAEVILSKEEFKKYFL